MTPEGEPFDRGLQVERTALAWRRTCLTLGAIALGGGRLLMSQLGTWTLAPAAVALAAAVAFMVASQARYRAQHVALTAARHPVLPGGGLPAALALVTVVLGLAALAATIASSG